MGEHYSLTWSKTPHVATAVLSPNNHMKKRSTTNAIRIHSPLISSSTMASSECSTTCRRQEAIWDIMKRIRPRRSSWTHAARLRCRQVSDIEFEGHLVSMKTGFNDPCGWATASWSVLEVDFGDLKWNSWDCYIKEGLYDEYYPKMLRLYEN